MLCAGLNGAMLYAVADGMLGGSPAYAGVLYAAQGIGSVTVGLLRRMPERVFAVGVCLRALPYDTVALMACALIGVGLPCVLIAAMTAVQRETPDAVPGRTSATAGTLMTAPNAVALLTAAWLLTGRQGRTPTGPRASAAEA